MCVCVCVYTCIYVCVYIYIYLRTYEQFKSNYFIEFVTPMIFITLAKYRVWHKSLTTLCKSQSMRNRWITTICDLIRKRGKSLGGVTLTAAILFQMTNIADLLMLCDLQRMVRDLWPIL
jgi:hypothetical protein